MMCVCKTKKFGIQKQQCVTNNLQHEGGMGFESSNSVVFSLVVLLSMAATLFDFKEAFLVVCEISLHWFLCGLHEQ